MTEQRRIIVIAAVVPFILGVPLGFLAGNLYDKHQRAKMDQATQVVTEPAVTIPAIESPLVTIVALDTRITESNDMFWQYAWKLRVKNETDSRLEMDAHLKWLDADGFEVDHDREYGIVLGAGEEATYTGTVIIRVPGASTVTSVTASMHRR